MSGPFDPPTGAPRQKSIACTFRSYSSPEIFRWIEPLKQRQIPHRKFWEWAYICEVLHERGMLAEGKRGLGFAVGQEPLTAFFAKHGCRIVATDLAPDRLEARWDADGQHAKELSNLNNFGICDPATLEKNVVLRHVNMNDIPADLRGFDFVWSSCSFEHLGSIDLGEKFLANMCDCLKPGGVAVHTTEFNVHSDSETIEVGYDVIFRRRDIERMAKTVEMRGCTMVERDYFFGDAPEDLHVDAPPYQHNPHLKLALHGFVATSFGVIVVKSKDRV